MRTGRRRGAPPYLWLPAAPTLLPSWCLGTDIAVRVFRLGLVIHSHDTHHLSSADCMPGNRMFHTARYQIDMPSKLMKVLMSSLDRHRTKAQRTEIKGLRSPREALSHILIFGLFLCLFLRLLFFFFSLCICVYLCT